MGPSDIPLLPGQGRRRGGRGQYICLVHNFAARKQKKDAILEQEANVVPEGARGSSQPLSDWGSDVQAIVILGSPEMSLNDQSVMGNVTLEESKEASSIFATLQVVHPPERATSQLDRAKYTRTGCRKPLLSDSILVNSYLPSRRPTPPMEEVTALDPKGAQKIVDQWRPFNRGEYWADHLYDLYLTMLQMPMAVRAGGRVKSIISQSLAVLVKKIINK